MIVITGATGNTGIHVIRHLLRRRPVESIVALVRAQSDTRELTNVGIRCYVCDLMSPDSYLPAVKPGAAFVGIANLRYSDAMLPHLERAGVERAFCVTTTAVYSTYHSYSALYQKIEERLMAAQLPVTLLRPSMIYGNDRDHNMRKLIRILNASPVFPVFGSGNALMQPVFVDDLAHGIVSAVERNATGAYNLAGPEAITYNEILQTLTTVLGRNVRFVHVNHQLAARIVNVLQRIPGFPVTHEQVMRLLEDKAFDISRSVADLDFSPRTFEDGIRIEVRERGKA